MGAVASGCANEQIITNPPPPSDDAGNDVGAAMEASVDAGVDVPVTRDVPASCAPAGYVRLGAVADFAVGQWRLDEDLWVIVGRDTNGFFVYSALCTHSRCVLPAPRMSGARSNCPCHGSVFDDQGRRLSGPATRDLPHYQALVCEGGLYYDESTVVALTARTTA